MQIEMTIKGLMVDPITNMPIVILRDKDGQQVLPIWVGIFEANAIALQIENISTPRPMTHDLLRNVIQDLKASVQKIVVCDLQENTFYALIYLRAERRHGGDRRAAERRDCAGAADARADLRRGSGHRQRQDGRFLAREEPTPTGCRSGSRASIRTISANTRCRCADLSASTARMASCPSDPTPFDDRRHRQPERRRGQDHDRHQSGRGPGAARQARRCSSISIRRPTARCRFSTCRRSTRSVYDAIADPAVALQDVILPSPRREPVDRAVADRAGQARGEAGGGDGRALPAEGQARAAPAGVPARSSSTARRRSAC